MRGLREIGDASSLILQFGPHKGATLADVAMRDPDYIRGLVNRARRPEVPSRGRLVSALEAAAEHKPRAPRGAKSKSSAKERSGPVADDGAQCPRCLEFRTSAPIAAAPCRF
jgi:hypothetical protein